MIADAIREVVSLLNLQDDNPRRRAFAPILTDVAGALEAIELVDAGEAAEGTENAAIDKALKSNEAQLSPTIAALLLRMLDRLNDMLIAAEKERSAPIVHQTVENMGGLIMALGFQIVRLGGDPAAIRAAWPKKGKNENPSTT
jgi:hypothetical protein